MKVGCVKEIKNNEFRVGLTPDAAKSYVNAGHAVHDVAVVDVEYVPTGQSTQVFVEIIWPSFKPKASLAFWETSGNIPVISLPKAPIIQEEIPKELAVSII